LSKRDPQYTSADLVPLYELNLLKNHYHPTVVKFVDFILENYKKDVIKYEGDPLMDFSLINFLEKFMLKNARVKKEKHKKKEKDENDIVEYDLDENGETIELNKDDKDFEELKNVKGESFDFIKIFADKKSKDTDTVSKKKKKKLGGLDADDVDADINIDDFADKIMDKEYKKIKFDKDIDDDDIDLSMGDDEDGDNFEDDDENFDDGEHFDDGNFDDENFDDENFDDEAEEKVEVPKKQSKKLKKKEKDIKVKLEKSIKTKGKKSKIKVKVDELQGNDFEGEGQDNVHDEFENDDLDDDYMGEEPELEDFY